MIAPGSGERILGRRGKRRRTFAGRGGRSRGGAGAGRRLCLGRVSISGTRGVWVSVCARMRAPARCWLAGGQGRGTALAWLARSSLLSAPPTLEACKATAPPLSLSPLTSALGRGPRGVGLAKVAVPSVPPLGAHDLAWPLLPHLCPARCSVPTYFMSVKNSYERDATVAHWRLATSSVGRVQAWVSNTGVEIAHFLLRIASCRSSVIVSVRKIADHLGFTLNTVGQGWVSLYFSSGTHEFSLCPQ